MAASSGEGQLSSTIEKSSSWAEMVRAIDYERKHLSWNPQIVKREKRIGHYDVSTAKTTNFFRAPTYILAKTVYDAHMSWLSMCDSFPPH